MRALDPHFYTEHGVARSGEWWDNHDPSAAAKRNGAGEHLIISASAPYDIARMFRSARYDAGGSPTLHHHRGGFYGWNGATYKELGDLEIRARVYEFLDQCIEVKDGKQRSFKPNQARVSNILDGLMAAANLSASIEPPAWLEPGPVDPADIIVCRNGLLHIPQRALIPHSPALFCHNAVDFDYAPDALAPPRWLEFLHQLWGDDTESIDTLQEAFGLMLTAETRHQKAFLLVGPKRSGKGTIARVLTGLVGRANCVSPTVASLGTNFGLAPLIHKRIAIISDARLSAKADQHAIAESILRITGEDSVSVDRKFRTAWEGQLQTRFFVISNELPRLSDTSGALASRFIVLRLVNSFYKREDHTLTDTLLTELPAIFNWALDGLRRLKSRRFFIQPASAAAAVQELEHLASPMLAFIRDCCDVGPACSVALDRLYEGWQQWCEQQGRDHPGTKQTFGRDLGAALPELKIQQPRGAEGRYRIYQGITLR